MGMTSLRSRARAYLYSIPWWFCGPPSPAPPLNTPELPLHLQLLSPFYSLHSSFLLSKQQALHQSKLSISKMIRALMCLFCLAKLYFIEKIYV